MDVLGAERLGGDDRDERGVDAAAESDDDVREAVLPAVVTGAEHERLVQLLLRFQQGDQRVVGRLAMGHRRCGHLDERQRAL